MILYDRQMTATFSSQVEKKTKPCTMSTPPRTLQMHSEGQCWQYISLQLPCLVVLGIVFAAHAKSRRPHELNALRRKLSKAPINYLQQHLNNYYFTRRLSVRPFGTFIRTLKSCLWAAEIPLPLKQARPLEENIADSGGRLIQSSAFCDLQTAAVLPAEAWAEHGTFQGLSTPTCDICMFLVSSPERTQAPNHSCVD